MHLKRIMENWRRYALVEGRLEKALAKVPDELKDDLQKVADNDPAGNLKYLGWAAKQLKSGAPTDDLIDAIDGFHKNKQRLDKKDIYQYSFKELENILGDLGLSKTKKKEKAKKEGSIKVYENDKYLAVAPTSTQASCVYGAGTKWCISSTEYSNMFRQYFHRDGVTFVFVMDKSKDETDETYKIALVYYPDAINDLERKYKLENGTLERGVPLEIYNAKDKLECKPKELFQIIQQRGQASGLRDHPDVQEYLNSELSSCEKYLDEYFGGNWKKFKGKFAKVVEEIGSKKEEYEKWEFHSQVEKMKDLVEKYTSGDTIINIPKIHLSSHRDPLVTLNGVGDINSDIFDGNYSHLALYKGFNSNNTVLADFAMDLSKDNILKTKIKHILEFIPPQTWLDTIKMGYESYLQDKGFDVDIGETTIRDYNSVILAGIAADKGEEAVAGLKNPDVMADLILRDIYRIANVSDLEDLDIIGAKGRRDKLGIEYTVKMIRTHVQLSSYSDIVTQMKDLEMHMIDAGTTPKRSRVILYVSDIDEFNRSYDAVVAQLRLTEEYFKLLDEYARNHINWDNPLIRGS